MVGENVNDLQDKVVENTEAKNENNAVNTITAADPTVVDKTVKQNKALEDAKTEIAVVPEQNINVDPQSLINPDMAAYYEGALNQNVLPNTLKANAYKEDFVFEDFSSAVEVTATGEITSTDENIMLYSQEQGTFTKSFYEAGTVESNTITGAVLDFTGSMKKDQLQAMINTLINLSKKGIITSTTKINIIHGVEDQNNDKLPIDQKIKKMDALNATIEKLSVSYGENGEGLKAALMDAGLIDQDRKVLVEQGKGCTPLYTTILDNLMNAEVRNATVFTDGASDIDAFAANGKEEPGSEQARDAMIKICKECNKKITIVSFNVNEGNQKKLNKMIAYFEQQGAGEYLIHQDLGTATGKDELASKIEKFISGNYELTIKEDPSLVKGRKLTIDNSKNTDNPNKNPSKENIQERPKDENGEEIVAEYDATDGTIDVDLGKLLPAGMNVNDYNITYTEEYVASIEQNINYSLGTKEDKTYLLDVSGSMGGGPGELMKNTNLYMNPSISYTGLLTMKKSISGFNSKKTDLIENYGENVKENNTINLDNPDVSYANKVYGLVFKAALEQYKETDPKYKEIVNALQKVNENQVITKPLIEKLAVYQKTLTEKKSTDAEYIQAKKGIDEINKELATKSVDQSVKSLYQELWKNPEIKNKEAEIKTIFSYIQKMESLGTGYGTTPLIEVVGKFGDKANNEKFLEAYRNQTMDFYTDFGENASTGPLKDLYYKMVESGAQSVYGKYLSAQKGFDETTKKIDGKNESLKKEVETNKNAFEKAKVNRLKNLTIKQNTLFRNMTSGKYAFDALDKTWGTLTEKQKTTKEKAYNDAKTRKDITENHYKTFSGYINDIKTEEANGNQEKAEQIYKEAEAFLLNNKGYNSAVPYVNEVIYANRQKTYNDAKTKYETAKTNSATVDNYLKDEKYIDAEKYLVSIKQLDKAEYANKLSEKEQTKKDLDKLFAKEPIVQDLQKNLVEYNIKINFTSPEKKASPQYYDFFSYVGEYLNTQNETGNKEGKELFTFEETKKSEGMLGLFEKEYAQEPATFERKTLTFNFKPKDPTKPTISKTIRIVDKGEALTASTN